jgi:hypothetical protein
LIPIEPLATERRAGVGIDQRPDASAKSGPEAARGKCTAFAGLAHERDSLRHLISQQTLGIRLGSLAQIAQGGLIASVERSRRVENNLGFRAEVSQAPLQRVLRPRRDCASANQLL